MCFAAQVDELENSRLADMTQVQHFCFLVLVKRELSGTDLRVAFGDCTVQCS